MAHDWAMKHGKSDSIYNRENTVQLAWEYADAMQDEADKREEQKDIANSESSKVFFEKLTDSRSLTKDENGNCLHFHHEFGHKKCMDCGASLEEWQPDWSQAPDWANWWVMTKGGFFAWVDSEPRLSNPHGGWLMSRGKTVAPSFNYAGNWQDSLRKRPQ